MAEAEGERRIPIIIGGFEAQAIVIKLENLAPPRPLTHDLVHTFATEFGVKIVEVLIYKLEEGVFYSQLVCLQEGKETRIDSRTSDAVALALRFECPIYTTEEILNKAGIVINPESGDDPTKVSKEESAGVTAKGEQKYKGQSDEEIAALLDAAIAGEDYELAASLRDEIEREKEKRVRDRNNQHQFYH